MKKANKYPVNFKEFKVKKRWWIWALGLLLNIIAIRCAMTKIYPVFVVILIADMFIIPDAAHFRYVLNDKFLEIKCIIFPTPDVLLSSIIAVESATLFTFRGFGVKLYEESSGAFKISYMEGRRQKALVITPKDSENFIYELGLRIDKQLILLHNKESAFKKKKDRA